MLIRVASFHGPYKIEAMKEDLLLAEANRGNLQSYIDSDDYFNTDKSLRQKWSLQIAEAVSYVHENGITHSNLSTANVLVHQAGQNIDLILADFGGSNCSDLGLSGHLLPDDPFFDPFVTNFESPKLDIFSLGVLLYIVNTGHWPFHTRPAPSDDERFAYEDFAHSQLEQNKFPDLTNVLFGNVIAGCCIERRFETAHEVVVALEAELEHNSP